MNKDLAQETYEVFCSQIDLLQPEPLPYTPWDALSPELKTAWIRTLDFALLQFISDIRKLAREG